MSHHADATTVAGRRATPATPVPAKSRATRLVRPGTAVAALAAVALTLAACGSSSPSSSATTAANSGGSGSGTGAAASPGTTAAAATVKTASNSKFGTILVNSAGMALYTYTPNNGGMTNMCTGACLQAWPAVTVPAGTTPTLASGVSGTLATAKQADGTLQVTYNGQLLYTFVSDTTPGQVTGNGVASFKVATTSSAPASGSGVAANNTPGTTKAPTTTRAPTTTKAPTTTAASGGGYQY
jgi:predicted lipoprotein with Yx(FWY)xxD motif